jgi:hypothetical protein
MKEVPLALAVVALALTSIGRAAEPSVMRAAVHLVVWRGALLLALVLALRGARDGEKESSDV